MKAKIKHNVVLLMWLLLILGGCTDDTIKIGLLMDGYAQQRWERDRDLFIENAEKRGAEVLVEVAEGDDIKQFEQAKKLIAEGADMLVVIPVNSSTAANIVALAHKSGIKVLSYDRLIKDCNLDFYISFDNVEVGRLQAEYMTTVKPAGNYAIFGGATSDNNSFLIRLGQMNVIQPLIEKGDITIVYDQFSDMWNEQEGYNHMMACYKKNGKNIDVIIAANDAIARGAIRALEEKNLAGKVLVCGQDAEVEACRAIIEGKQTMTVYKPIESIARESAIIAIEMAQGGIPKNIHLSVNNGKKMVPAILLPSMVVNKETIRLTVVADGYLEENAIYQ